MPKVSLIQQNFNGGEYGQGLKLRSDLQQYYNGGERVRNFFPTKEGNLKFRTGLYYNRTTDTNNKTILIDFIVSVDERYVLEFSNLVLRVFKDDVQIGTDIVSPYREADLFNIETAQEKSFMIIVDGVHPPYRLTSGTTFTLALEQFNVETTSQPPLLSENLGAITITNSATTGTITLTASAALFNVLDVGRYVKIRDLGGVTGFARITVFTSTTVVTAVVWITLPAAAAYSTWTFSMLPEGVCFYEQRLVYGQLNIITFSKTPDDNGIVRYNDFETGTAVDDAMRFESGLLKGKIQWLVPTDRMVAIGTYTGIFKADGGTNNESLSPENPPTIKQISVEGTTNITPVKKDNIVFFVSRDLKRIFSMQYNFDSDGYLFDDVMLLNKEIAEDGITQLAYKLGDENILYAIKTDGELLGLVHNPQQQIKGWFRYDTEGSVESVVSVPLQNGTDRVYVSVNRTINSSTVRYIEYFTEEISLSKREDFFSGVEATDQTAFDFARWEEKKDFVYLDSAVIYDGSDSTHSTQTMTPSATTGTDITFTAGGALFSSSDVGREIWEKLGTGRAKIITYVSNTVVKCNITAAFASTSAIAAGDWYFTSKNFTGLSHLEAETVSVIRDGGKDTGTYTVSGGEITITQQASKATIGLLYKGVFKSMALQGGARDGASQAKPKLVNKFGVYFLNTSDAKFGTDPYNLNEVQLGPSAITGRPIEAFTGYKKLDLPERYEEEKHIYIIQESPLPCTVQAIIPLMEANSE
jgi:hypothetical protein